ncbi:unnamed protein product [Staurois parvus]|uniref:Uncharacterized protein n=1 Tax=Staurois parvus TaxID=386267 RepID=A0ABN9CGC3_9NEOB|nr:unnamed protein product [Staurois parvus]
MEKEPSHVTERILNLTLEIVYLLTEENYIAFKISDGLVASKEMKTQSQVEPPSPPPSNKEVQEVTSEINELLNGENSITFKLSKGFVAPNLKTQSPTAQPPSHSLGKNRNVQDVITEIIDLLTGEEGQCLEGHKDLYKEVMMENHPPLTLPDGPSSGNPPVRCPSPLYSRDSEPLGIQKDDQVILDTNQTDCSTEANEKVEDLSVISDDPCKEEEIPPEISTDPGDTRETREMSKLKRKKIFMW